MALSEGYFIVMSDSSPLRKPFGHHRPISRIPEDYIKSLIARTDLVELVGGMVKLKRVGNAYTACCPFHAENTPSFRVSPQKQTYHCFGCGAHGNALDFVMANEGLSFLDGLRRLASWNGVPFPEGKAGAGKRGRFPAPIVLPPAPTPPAVPRVAEEPPPRLYALQSAAARHFQRMLHRTVGADARNYLMRRGMDRDTALRFQLGFAPKGNLAAPTGLAAADLFETGLAFKSERTKTGYLALFRERVVFPIRDVEGRVVGFGGRALGDDGPKYLNSPETRTFKKSRELYGLYELIQDTPRPDAIVVVEGYMDVIALAQHGVKNAVATLGTATTEAHVERLFQHTRRLVFCFDGDTAGRKAALKALDSALPYLTDERDIDFLSLPEGHDPDTLIREEGGAAFRDRIEKAQPWQIFWRQAVGLDAVDPSAEARAEALDKTQEILERIPLGKHAQNLLECLTPKSSDLESPVQKESRPPSVLRKMVTLLIQHPALSGHLDESFRFHLEQHPKVGGLMQKLLPVLRDHPDITLSDLRTCFRNDPVVRLLDDFIAKPVVVAESDLQAEFKQVLVRFAHRYGLQLPSRSENADAGTLELMDVMDVDYPRFSL